MNLTSSLYLHVNSYNPSSDKFKSRIDLLAYIGASTGGVVEGSKGYEKVKPLIMSTHPLGCGVYIRCRYQFEAV